MPVLVAAGAGGVLVLAAYAGVGVLALAVVGVQAMLAYGLTAARNLPGSTGSGALVLLAGAAAVVALRVADPQPSGPTVAPLLWVLGPAVVGALVLQLVRRDGRERTVELLAMTASGLALAGLLALLVPLAELPPLVELAVPVAVGGSLLGVTVWWLAASGAGWSRWLFRALAVAVVLVAAAALAAADIPELTATGRAAMGTAVTVGGLVGAGAGTRLADTRTSRAVLVPAVAVAFSGPAAYLTARVLFW